MINSLITNRSNSRLLSQQNPQELWHHHWCHNFLVLFILLHNMFRLLPINVHDISKTLAEVKFQWERKEVRLQNVPPQGTIWFAFSVTLVLGLRTEKVLFITTIWWETSGTLALFYIQYFQTYPDYDEHTNVKTGIAMRSTSILVFGPWNFCSGSKKKIQT